VIVVSGQTHLRRQIDRPMFGRYGFAKADAPTRVGGHGFNLT
jgi:hypothetical protein